MFSTTKLLRLASTHNGMRRILKRPIAVDEFVKNAIRTGVYLGADEDRTTVERRHRRQEYPDEYQILTLHPPLPQPPRVPLRYQRKVKHIMQQQKGSGNTPESRQRAAMRSYLARNTSIEHGRSDKQSLDDYYRALLGIPAPPPTTVMGQKSTLVNKAYVFAVKQEEVMRSGDGMSEEESLQVVEQLLQEEAKQERHESRKVQQEVQEWRRKEQASAKDDDEPDDMTMNATDDDDMLLDSTTLLDSFSNTNHQKSDNYDNDDESTPSILHSRPRTIQGMAIWSNKLAAVPYRDWTIGASVALDHFVARSILELSEETWVALLEGDGDMKSIGQDIVLTRQALFPETLQVQTEDEDEDGARDATAVLDDVMNVGDKSIDELLASLGGDSLMEDDDDDDDKDSFLWTTNNSGEESTTDQLVDELQEWRQRNVDQPYEDWSAETRADFQEWMQSYVATLMGDDDDGTTVDWEETRHALLDAPPMTREDNEEFWNAIRDETQAEIWLSTLQQQQDEGVLAPFWKLPHGEQVQRLVALTQLRPIVDEYATTTTREAFMERHANKLLEGLDLEHLVLDSNGPISGGDLLKKWSNNHAAHAAASDDDDIKETDRFSVVTMPYDGSRKKSRAMLEAWNSFKVGRAQYEEHLYKSGKLGLRYSDKVLLKKDNDNDEEE